MPENITNGPQLQSSLGEATSTKTKKDRNWNMGYLALGKVVRIHPKRYTADVQIFKTNDMVTSTKDQEGRHACRIGVDNAGYNEIYGKAYGEIVPIRKGSIVLVGFLKNSREKPVILRVFHDIGEELGESNYKNILNTTYSQETDDEILKYIRITGIQDFVSMDDEGNFEIASHTKSFFVGKERAMDDEGYDFEDLEVKNPDQTTRCVEERYSAPKKYIAVFRDNYVDSLTNWLKIIVDAAKTTFKLAKLQQLGNKSTWMEIDENGAFRLRRQLDTKSFEDSKQYAEISIDQDAKITIKFTGDTKTTITINPDGTGIVVETTDPLQVTTERDITVQGQNIHLTAGKAINMNAPKINLN